MKWCSGSGYSLHADCNRIATGKEEEDLGLVWKYGFGKR